ncbi:hypothetical protein WA171_000672 [Blastocystis sp. BT1]
MNIQDNDILIHCTDNPGRVTFLRTSILQKQKTDESLSVDSAYSQCIQDLLTMCKVEKIRHLFVKIVNKRADGTKIVEMTMQAVIQAGIHVSPITNCRVQPSSKTRRPSSFNSRRRYHKDSYSQEIAREIESWKTKN